MIAGQYAVHEGAVHQVTRVIATSVAGHGGLPVRATRWELVRADDRASGCSIVTPAIPAGETRRGVRRDDYPTLAMLPACRSCKASAGYACLPTCDTGTEGRA